jgi:inorganic pyrophosphatase
MSLDLVTPGKNVPEAFNVIIEIPMNADPVKYEVDKETGAIFVDRFMSTSMHYPTNYGYVPKTISGDGDPVDVLVITPVPLIPGVVVPCRPIGILKMQDEAGDDAKVLAVPTDKILAIYTQWQKPEDLNPLRLKTIAHFFEHYKDLEPGKWVKVLGWEGPESAKKEVLDLAQAQLVHVGGLLPVLVDRQDLVDRHREQLGIATGFVLHLQEPDRPARDDDAGGERKRRDHQHVDRVAVVAERLRDVAVVARVVHRRAHEAVDEHRAAFLVDLVLDRVGVHRDLDDHVELVGRTRSRSDVVQAHGGAASQAKAAW